MSMLSKREEIAVRFAAGQFGAAAGPMYEEIDTKPEQVRERMQKLARGSLVFAEVFMEEVEKVKKEKK